MIEVMNIRSVKLALTQPAGLRLEPGGGCTDGGTDEEGQDRGVRQGEYIIMLLRGGRERGEEMRGDGLENGALLG